MSETSSQLRTVSRALDVLSLIERSAAPLTLTEITKRLGETPPVIFRILKTLEARGYLHAVEGSKRYAASRQHDRLASARQLIGAMRALSARTELPVGEVAERIGSEPDEAERLLLLMRESGFAISSKGGGWSLSPQLLGMMRSIAPVDVVGAARPIMRRLRERTGETVALFVRAGLSQVLVDIVQSQQPLRYTVDIGTVFPMDRGAAGKALLALLPEGEVGEILRNPALSLGEAEVAARMARLADVRRVGYALSFGERVPGAAAVAAAMVGDSGEPLAVMNVLFPSGRVSEARMCEFGTWLLAELEDAGFGPAKDRPARTIP